MRKRKVAPPRDRQMTFRPPLYLFKKIHEAAEKEHRSINQWFIAHFEAFFQKKGKR